MFEEIFEKYFADNLYSEKSTATLLLNTQKSIVQYVYQRGIYQLERGKVNHKTLEDIRKDIDELVKELYHADWQFILDNYHQEYLDMMIEKRQAAEYAAEQDNSCDKCGKLLKNRDLHHGEFGDARNDWLCIQCIEQNRIEYTRKCILCKTEYFAKRVFDGDLLCSSCYSPSFSKELRRIVAHNNRARKLGLSATLTLSQWLSTLDYFEWKCAYCTCDFTGLEHYTPLSIGKGSTVDNCLPSCNKCNMRKRDKSPEQFASLFPTENIARIKAYFASLELTEAA